jgi:hypothetical protein
MMKTAGVGFSTSLIFSCFLFLLSAQESIAYWESENGMVYVTGWAENFSSMRLEDEDRNALDNRYEKGNIQTFRNTLQVETNVKLNPNCEFFTIARGYYEGSWDIDHSLPSEVWDMEATHHGDRMGGDIDLREYYMTFRQGPVTLKLGSQQVIWGESDALRMADIVNPLDVSWHYVFENWEDIRIPLRMVNLLFEPSTQNQFRMQVIYIPEDFRTWSWAPEGAPHAIPGVPQFFWDQQKNELPDRNDFSNGEYGVRFQAAYGGWEFSLFDFYSRVDNFVYSYDPTHAPLPLKFEWPRANVIGGTYNVFNDFLSTVFRGECAYTMDQPYQSEFLERIIKKDTFAFMMGFDRPTMWQFLNKKSFFISGQFFYKSIINYDTDIVSLDMSRDDTQCIVSLLINTTYLHDTLTPGILCVADFSGDGFFQPSIKYAPSDRWEVTLASNFIWGTAYDDGYFGREKKDDEIFLRFRLKF